MAKYIDKAALVAWAKETYLCENASMIRKVCYKQLLEHLDTLEVKEVKEEPASEELEEAAQEYVTKEGCLAGLHYNSVVRSFKAGAEWYASHNTKLPDKCIDALTRYVDSIEKENKDSNN